MASPKDLTLRFAVGDPAEYGAVWHVSSPRTKSDVYIMQSAFGEVLKVSLHETGAAHYKWTPEGAAQAAGRGEPLDSPYVDKWYQPPPFDSGISRSFSIVVPKNQLRPDAEHKSRKPSKQVIWVDASGHGNAVEVVVALAVQGRYTDLGSTWPGKTSSELPTELVGRYFLSDGRSVSIVAFDTIMHPEILAKVRRYQLAVINGGFNLAGLPEPRGMAHVVNPDGHRYALDYALTLECAQD